MPEGFLGKLSREQTDALHAVAMPRSYGPHVEILHEGNDAGAVVVLLRGRVKVATIGAGGARRSWQWPFVHPGQTR
jgi:CRP-like cAMP-binding protein